MTKNIKISLIEENKGQIDGLPKNPRFIKNEKYKKLVKSIEENPEMLSLREILVYPFNGRYIIIGGNMRFRAIKELGYKKEVPCKVIPETATIEQLKAYTIKDNSGFGEWDMDLLANEWDVEDLDDWGVDLPDCKLFVGEHEEEEDEEEKVNERERTYNNYNLHYFDNERARSVYDIPNLEKTFVEKPKRLVGFNYALSSPEDKSIGIHCFLDDYQIERLWSSPDKYVECLQKFKCILTPDFSLYSDMPNALMIYNTYRSRLVGQIFQDYGLNVVPTISWADERTFEFCFEGIEQGSIVAISTIGVKQKEENKNAFYKGFEEMIKRINPREVWCYGGEVELNCNCKVSFFENEITNKLNNL